MNKLTQPILSFLLIAALCGCNDTSVVAPDVSDHHHAEETSTDAPIDVEALLKREAAIVEQAPAKVNNKIAFDLYGKLKDTENLTFSPFSISLALAMTYAGSTAESEQTMKTVLGFGDNNESFHKSFGEFANVLRKKPRSDETMIKISNVQWLDKAFVALSSYTEALAKNYGAQPVTLDFKNDAADATDTINKAIAEQTNDKITKLFKSPLPQATPLILTNAIYFKSDWASKFKPLSTADGEFALKGGKSVNVKYMKQVSDFRYAEDEQQQALLLPYRDEDFAALLVLPKEGKLAEVENSLNQEGYEGLFNQLESTNVEVWLPKFAQRTTPGIKPVLTDLGLGIIFDRSKADFSRITGDVKVDERLFVEDIAHEALVEMDEDGTVAAAATGVQFGITSFMPTPENPKKFHATRPFIFYLIHAPSKTILFMGRVDEPKLP